MRRSAWQAFIDVTQWQFFNNNFFFNLILYNYYIYSIFSNQYITNFYFQTIKIIFAMSAANITKHAMITAKEPINVAEKRQKNSLWDFWWDFDTFEY